MSLVQIVPRLPPPPEGIGSYALALARALEADHGLATTFLVPAPHGRERAALGSRVLEVAPAAADLAARLAELGAERVLLHYANYGYAPRGCPLWLAGGLERFRAGGAGRLVTIFHEVYATGPPWASSFWLHPVQRRIAARVARASAGLGTSLPLYAAMLARWTGTPARVRPVFSTVGEPVAVGPLAERPARLVLFGGRGARARAYAAFPRLLGELAAALELCEIRDIGPPIAAPAEIGGIPVRPLGILPEEAVSAELLAARAGFLAYPEAFLGKSTIYAAYAAHGVLPISAWEGEGSPKISPESAQELASAAHRWYGDHRLPRQAADLLQQLRP